MPKGYGGREALIITIEYKQRDAMMLFIFYSIITLEYKQRDAMISGVIHRTGRGDDGDDRHRARVRIARRRDQGSSGHGPRRWRGGAPSE